MLKMNRLGTWAMILFMVSCGQSKRSGDNLNNSSLGNSASSLENPEKLIGPEFAIDSIKSDLASQLTALTSAVADRNLSLAAFNEKLSKNNLKQVNTNQPSVGPVKYNARILNIGFSSAIKSSNYQIFPKSYLFTNENVAISDFYKVMNAANRKQQIDGNTISLDFYVGLAEISDNDDFGSIASGFDWLQDPFGAFINRKNSKHVAFTVHFGFYATNTKQIKNKILAGSFMLELNLNQLNLPKIGSSNKYGCSLKIIQQTALRSGVKCVVGI